MWAHALPCLTHAHIPLSSSPNSGFTAVFKFLVDQTACICLRYSLLQVTPKAYQLPTQVSLGHVSVLVTISLPDSSSDMRGRSPQDPGCFSTCSNDVVSKELSSALGPCSTLHRPWGQPFLTVSSSFCHPHLGAQSTQGLRHRMEEGCKVGIHFPVAKSPQEQKVD